MTLASTDGQIVGGGVGGPLIAGGPIQVFYFQEYFDFLSMFLAINRTN